MSFAVLGDSDSHSYHDFILIPKNSSKRGGKFRPTTWQWTEILAQLRGQYIDQGKWGVWGTPVKVAEIMAMLGLGGRAPRKQDFRFNFAVSGAECSDLMTGCYRQAPRLLTLMDREPERWKTGVVSIRIGINTIGQTTSLELYAREGTTPAVKAKILESAGWVRQAVDLIRHKHMQTRFVLVGICDNSDWPPNFNRWADQRERENISSALDVFDDAMRSIVVSDPHAVFFDDRAWFESYWGGRGATGQPSYRSVDLGGRMTVQNTQGDEPTNAVLADGHAGSVWNGLWAADYVSLLNRSFGMSIPPMTTEEIAQFVVPDSLIAAR